MREYRGTLTEPGKDSPYRNRSVEENLKLIEMVSIFLYDFFLVKSIHGRQCGMKYIENISEIKTSFDV